MSQVSLPLKYHTLSVTTLGSPIEPVIKEISSIAANEIIVKVHYSSINPMDGKLQNYNFFQIPMPLTLGFDISGTVVAVGQSVTAFQVGDQVFGCAQAGGGFGEYVKINPQCVAKVGGIPLKEAAAFGVAFLSAYEPLFLVDDLTKRKGQFIYVAGGGGGVGHFAVQLALIHGLKVISSAGKPESIKLLKDLGSDVHVLDYSKQDVVKEILQLTSGKGVDVVYDPTYSPSSFKQGASVIASGGHWVRLGDSDDSNKEAVQILESRGGSALFGSLGRYWYDPKYISKSSIFSSVLSQATIWYQQGKINSHINSTVPLKQKELQEAIAASAKGQASGGKGGSGRISTLEEFGLKQEIKRMQSACVEDKGKLVLKYAQRVSKKPSCLQ